MACFQFIVGLIGASQANTYEGLMVARVIQCFGSGVCEALPVQLVNDIFFLHERGKYIGFYTCEYRADLSSSPCAGRLANFA